MSLVQKILKRTIKGAIRLSTSMLLDRYELTKELTIALSVSGQGFIFRTKTYGSPWNSDNATYESRYYPTREAAASAAIKEFEIVNITEWGDAVYRPVKKAVPPGNCKRCAWYSADASFCAVAPSYLGHSKECPEFELDDCKKLAPPKVELEKRFQMAKALKKGGIV